MPQTRVKVPINGNAEPAPGDMPGTRMKVSVNGRIVIPASYRKALGIEPGDEVVMDVRGDEIRISRLSAAVRRAQAIVAKHVPADAHLSHDLIHHRRRENSREHE